MCLLWFVWFVPEIESTSAPIPGLLLDGSQTGGWAQSPGDMEKVTFLLIPEASLCVGGKILLGREPSWFLVMWVGVSFFSEGPFSS